MSGTSWSHMFCMFADQIPDQWLRFKSGLHAPRRKGFKKLSCGSEEGACSWWTGRKREHESKSGRQYYNVTCIIYM